MIDNLVRILKAIGEPTRLRTLALLREGELAVSELSRILGQSQPRISRHLKLLTDAQVIERRAEGAWVFYRLGGDVTGLLGVINTAISLMQDSQDPMLQRDRARLEDVRRDRAAVADAYFESVAHTWDAERAKFFPQDQSHELILAWAAAARPARAVDLGTGPGRLLPHLARLAGQVEGIDLSARMLAVARANIADADLSNIVFRKADLQALPLPDQCADFVVLQQVLHYLPDPDRVLAEAARIVAPGGVLVVADLERHDLEELRNSHAHRRLGFDDAEITDMPIQAGLSLAATEVYPPLADAAKLTVKVWQFQRPHPEAPHPQARHTPTPTARGAAP